MTVCDFQVFGRVRAPSGGRVSVVLGRIRAWTSAGCGSTRGRSDSPRRTRSAASRRASCSGRRSKGVLSALFADYADRREVQAALPATTLTLAPDADGGLWFD